MILIHVVVTYQSMQEIFKSFLLSRQRCSWPGVLRGTQRVRVVPTAMRMPYVAIADVTCQPCVAMFHDVQVHMNLIFVFFHVLKLKLTICDI